MSSSSSWTERTSTRLADLPTATSHLATCHAHSRSQTDTCHFLDLHRYHCDACAKKVDAKKGYKITTVPPVLTLVLRRFEMDWMAGM